MNESSLLIVGSIGLDEIKTPFESKKNVIGGSTTYSLIAASNNISVSIVGIIGNDFPDYGHQIFQSKASNLDDLQVVEGKHLGGVVYTMRIGMIEKLCILN